MSRQLSQISASLEPGGESELVFLVGHVHPDELSRLSKTCDGRGGICSRTGRPHLQLEGASPEGVRWTSIAQTYPQALNRALAKTLVSQARSVLFQV